MLKLTRIAPTLVMTLATLCAATGASAATPDAAFVLEGYERPGAPRWITTGRYEDLIDERARTRALDRFSASDLTTNLCIAYIKTSQLRRARTACDQALSMARAERATGSVAWSYSSEARMLNVARNYSNRAVLNWVLGDKPAAETDLARAAALAPQAHFVVRNATALAHRGYGAAVVAALAADGR